MNITTKTNGTNFFSSGLRQKVDQLMDILYSGGVNNPMDSIEQISYLLFLRLLTEKDEMLATLDKKYTRIFSGKWARFAWGNSGMPDLAASTILAVRTGRRSGSGK